MTVRELGVLGLSHISEQREKRDGCDMTVVTWPYGCWSPARSTTATTDHALVWYYWAILQIKTMQWANFALLSFMPVQVLPGL